MNTVAGWNTNTQLYTRSFVSFSFIVRRFMKYIYFFALGTGKTLLAQAFTGAKQSMKLISQFFVSRRRGILEHWPQFGRDEWGSGWKTKVSIAFAIRQFFVWFKTLCVSISISTKTPQLFRFIHILPTEIPEIVAFLLNEVDVCRAFAIWFSSEFSIALLC